MRLKLHTKQAKKAGMSPGVLIHVGEKKIEKVRITAFSYDREKLEEKEVAGMEEACALHKKKAVTWINIDGLHEIDVLEKIGAHFQIHPLVLEDILNSGHRPKIEDHENYLFVVVKMLTCPDPGNSFIKENVSILYGADFVITFQERQGDVLNQIRERIRTENSRLRQNGADYLLCRILDTIVDHYFTVLDAYGERIEQLEIEVIEEPDQTTLNKIHQLKRELLLLRRPIWPAREVLNSLYKSELPSIKKETHLFLRDVYDHIVQVNDAIDNFRELVSGLLDVYLSNVSNRMNEVMKVLTIIATIFIPMTFIAGIYGMNFEWMPELKWQWGYFAVWGVMLVMCAGMLIYFRRKKWL